MSKSFYRSTPEVLRKFIIANDATIVGSAAKWLAFNTDSESAPRDWDIIIEPQRYQDACNHLSMLGVQVTFNTFGGLKFKLDGIEIDMWPSTIDTYLNSRGRTDNLIKLNGNIHINIASS